MRTESLTRFRVNETARLVQGDSFLDESLAHSESLAAVDDRGNAVTYAELFARSDEIRESLGDTEGLLTLECANTVDWLVAYVAVIRSRRPCILIPGDRAELSARIASRFSPAATLSMRNGYCPEPGAGPSPECHPDLALLLSTSGTTGSLKFVRLSHRNLSANATSIAEYLGIERSERGTVNLPTHYSYGLSIVNSHLARGATLLLTDKSVADEGFWAFLAEHGATSFAGVPHTYQLLGGVDFTAKAPASLNYFTQAGGRLDSPLVKRFGEFAKRTGRRFFVMYGQTEATARIAYLPPEQLLDHPDCIGVPIPGGSIELVDETGAGAIQAIGVSGELVYRGPNVMMGYAERGDDLALASGPAILATGDVAERVEGGLFKITGRKGRFIKPFGLRVGLDDVERTLSERGISALATGSDAKLQIATSQSGASPEIARVVENEFGLPKLAYQVLEVESYPLLESGKFDYRRLATFFSEPVTGEGPTEHFTEASTPEDLSETERQIAKIWQDTLGVEEVGRNDSFHDLGGDSLSAVGVLIQLEKAGLPPEILQRILAGETVAQIAAAVDTGNREIRTGDRAVRSDALNAARGVFALIIVIAHWGPFFAERLGSVGGALWSAVAPVLRIGTPGFAMIYGMGLGLFFFGQIDRGRARLRRRIRNNTALLVAGVLLVAAVSAWRIVASGESFGPIWPERLFYTVLLFYVLMVPTSVFWLRRVAAAKDRVFASLLLACGAYAVHALAAAIVPVNPFTGWASLAWHMMVAPYAYPRLLGAVALGIAMALWLQRPQAQETLVQDTAKWGLVLGLLGFLLVAFLPGGWPANAGTVMAIPAFAGAATLLYAGAAHVAGRQGRPWLFRVAVVTGMLAFPIFVGHSLVMPAKGLLVAYGMIEWAATLVPAAVFAIAIVWLGVRLHRMMFAGTRSR